MSELKNSALLDTVIVHAKTAVNENSLLLTAEKFLTAVLDLMEDASFVSQNREELMPVLSRCEQNGVSLPKAKSELQRNVDLAVKTDAEEELALYMETKMAIARQMANDQQLDLLPLHTVLECIFASPSPIIETVFGKAEPAPNADDISMDLDLQSDIQALLQGEKTDTTGDCAGESTDIKGFAESEEPVETDDPKQAVSALTERVKNTQETLLSCIFGQDNAVSVFTTGYFQAELLAMTDKKRVRPRATFLFAGPPGVGKTFLAEKAAEILKRPFMRFDMSEYADKEANLEFCGADKVYKSAKPGNVTDFVANHPKCVLLFDEVEKAHLCVIHLFLQILDAGRLRDNYTDQEVSFSNAIIIFTTNAGKQLYENADNGDFSGVSRKVILNALQKDLNPETGAPFFPAAICSRFASGNVVMFNHIASHNLREIAKKEVLRHAENFEKEIGIKVEIEDAVYTALLFAEGGTADARTIRSRAETFFDDELFELFRLIASEKVASDIQDLEKISICVDLPQNNPELRVLFEHKETQSALVFAAEETVALCSAMNPDLTYIPVQDTASAVRVLHKQDIQFVLVDLTFGQMQTQQYLNFEDVASSARDFLHYMREQHRDLPIYILQTQARTYNEEERVSFLRQGVRGIVPLTAAEDVFKTEMHIICDNLHQQRSMTALAKANKMVMFETAQVLSADGKHAEIRLFDFAWHVAVDAEDTQNILSNISKPNVRFDQVIGAQDAKKELQYFVEYLKNPNKYLGTGVRAPKGVLLYGPPGTGKTMLAKAMASESDVTFITAEGNQFLKKYVGEGPDKVHELFRTARKYAPSILFVDEIDAIAKERRGGERAAAGEETLTAFLTEMDGFKNDPSRPVFVLAATNFDVESGHEKSLDPALMRRFDRRVYIDLPNREDRLQFIRLKLESHSAFEISEKMVESIAIRSTGMSLAALDSAFELALRSAIRDGNLKVTDAILEEAFETFNSGEAKKWDLSLLERVARHEAGHAFLCWKGGETPSYVTIVARANHGGYMQHADNEGKAIYTKEELLAKIRTSLGGRAAELVYYGEKDGISTGASGDLASATNLAEQIICTYGMDASFGLAVANAHNTNAGAISSEIRTAVNRILHEELQTAVQLISENRDRIDALVQVLMTKNHLTGSEIQAVFEQKSQSVGETV